MVRGCEKCTGERILLNVRKENRKVGEWSGVAEVEAKAKEEEEKELEEEEEEAAEEEPEKEESKERKVDSLHEECGGCIARRNQKSGWESQEEWKGESYR